MTKDFSLPDSVEQRIAGIQAIYNRFRDKCLEKNYPDAHEVAYDLTILYLEQTRKTNIAIRGD